MFDKAASTYDQDFTHTDLGLWLRQRVWQRLTMHFSAGDHVLEIGCGTGEDAIFLAQLGIHVTATDVSNEMLKQTQAKAEQHNLTHLITTKLLDLNHLSPFDAEQKFDGAFSNFGPVNCTQDWSGLAEFLHHYLKPNAIIGLGVMSRFCLWETLWHGLHGDFATASRRWNGQAMATLADGSQFEVYYPSIRQMNTAFASHFTTIDSRGMGVFLPPSDSFAVIEKRPALAKSLQRLEQTLAHLPPFKFCADHFWIEMQHK